MDGRPAPITEADRRCYVPEDVWRAQRNNSEEKK